MEKLKQEQITKLKKLAAEQKKIENELFSSEKRPNLIQMVELRKKLNMNEKKVKLFEKWQNENEKIKEWQKVKKESDGLNEKEIEQELDILSKNRDLLEQKIVALLNQAEKKNNKNFLVEIRGAAGGEEANLFARELANCYLKVAKNQKWTTEIIDKKTTETGGYSFFSMLVRKPIAYSMFKWESGVHRVQRIPETETQGRVHTSTVTVALMLERDEGEMPIETKDLRIDTFRSSGAGGQHVNTTNSAIRVTHLPTNIIVSCQEGRSQHDNKEKALKVLRARLYDWKEKNEQANERKRRNEQIGQGMRNEKIRTYNFPQNRITDHQNNLTISNIDRFFNGNIIELWDKIAQN